jgi:hypothetical protein
VETAQSASEQHCCVQAQEPPWQVWPDGQALPHEPQFWASLDVSTHAPPQGCWPWGQAQLPPWQV